METEISQERLRSALSYKDCLLKPALTEGGRLAMEVDYDLRGLVPC